MIYRFGVFTLDEQTRQLLADERECALSPKAFELLTTLLANHPRALAKSELQERLWPDTYVQETNLAGLVAEIRRALDDSAAAPRYVRTVHRFGYRFVADVAVVTGSTRSPTAALKCYLTLGHRHFHLLEGANVIGRAPEATIHVESPGLSRAHARLVRHGGVVTIEDLNSKNGTYVNGHRVSGAISLSDTDEVRLGGIVMTFRLAEPAGSTATVLGADRL